MQKTPGEVVALFKKEKIKVTPQRLAIYHFLQSRIDHPTAQQIHQEIKKQFPTISLATVYNSLHLLQEKGIIQELSFSSKDVLRYDPNTDLHINVVCQKCGIIRDYKPNKLENFWKEMLKDCDLNVVGKRIDIYNFCDECQSNS